MLESEGYHCHIANNGKEAIQLFEKIPLNAILMDIEMPEMNGLEATQAIRGIEKQRANGSAIPILGVSAYARQERGEEAQQLGMNDYLTKPYDKDQLLEKLAFYIQQHPSVSPSTNAPSLLTR